MLDFKPSRALLRAQATLGLKQEAIQTVANKASQLMTCGYVLKELQNAIDAAQEKNLVNRNRIVAGLVREANVEGIGASHGARVAAWTKLANIMRMDVKQIEANLSSKGGILVVPTTQKADDWEKRAAEAQAALKAEVRK